jgi:hypothetical protein
MVEGLEIENSIYKKLVRGRQHFQLLAIFIFLPSRIFDWCVARACKTT